MRCADCETEPLNLARYCECCGREMFLHETQAEEPSLFGEEVEETRSSLEAEEVDASGVEDWAPNPNPTSDLRYQSFNGGSLDGDSSPPRQEPSAITDTDPATPQSHEVTASPETQPVEETFSSASMASTALSPDPSGHAIVANAETPEAPPEATPTSVKDKVAVAKAVEPEAVKTREALPKRANVDAIQTERASEVGRRHQASEYSGRATASISSDRGGRGYGLCCDRHRCALDPPPQRAGHRSCATTGDVLRDACSNRGRRRPESSSAPN